MHHDLEWLYLVLVGSSIIGRCIFIYSYLESTKKLISKEMNCVGHEHMNIDPPNIVVATPLG